MADRMLVAFGKYLRLLRDRRKMSLSDVVTLTKSYPEPVGKGYSVASRARPRRIGFSKMVAYPGATRSRSTPSARSSPSTLRSMS
jgi:hypothetical protein